MCPLPFIASAPDTAVLHWFIRKALNPQERIPDHLAGRVLFHYMMDTYRLSKWDQNRIKNASGTTSASLPLEEVLDQHPEWKILFHSMKPGGRTDTIPPPVPLLQDACEILWSQEEYPLAIRLAFYHFMSGSNDSSAVFLVCEGIRRMIARSPGAAFKSFGAEGFRSALKNQSIWADLRLLDPDTSRLRHIPGAPQNPPFRNYQEALEWFLRIPGVQKEKEIHLTAALWYFRDRTKRDSCLRLYLAGKEIRYRDFAIALQAGSPDLALGNNSRTLTVIFPLDQYVRTATGLEGPLETDLSFNPAALVLRKFPGPNLDVSQLRDPDLVRKLQHFRRLCAGSSWEPVSVDEHCTGYTLHAEQQDSSRWRKRSPFLQDPELWYWFRKEGLRNVTFVDPYMWEKPSEKISPYFKYIPVLFPFLTLRYFEEYKNGSPAYAFGVQSIRLEPKAPVPVHVSTETNWKKIRKTYFLNVLHYNAGELEDGRDKNRGFEGRKNFLTVECIPILHNGLFKLNYSRSITKHFMLEAGYGYFTKKGNAVHVGKDSLDIDREEKFHFSTEGSTWSASLLLNSRYSGLPAPAGLYLSFGIERTRNNFSEQPDTASEAFTYENRSFAFTFAGGGNVMLGGGWVLDLGLRTGWQFGHIKPLHSASAYRVPYRQYPDTWLWDRSNRFEYTLADDDVGGTGTNTFATFRLFYSRLLCYPVLRLGYLF